MRTKKQTLGPVLRDRREELRLTQRELAAKLGVKASHVAYLENGRRRPSLSLLKRLAVVLGLDSQTILLLAHPEAGALLTEAKHTEHRNAWKEFTAGPYVLRHRITKQELELLKRVAAIGSVSSPGQFIFVLNSIRQATESMAA